MTKQRGLRYWNKCEELEQAHIELRYVRSLLSSVCAAARTVLEAPDKIPYAGEDERFWALVSDLRLAVERAEAERGKDSHA